MKEAVCVFVDIDGLVTHLGFEHIPEEWRLFIDSSKASLKAVLLHNGTEKPSIPVAHAVNMKENFESMSLILRLINYDKFGCLMCGDLKVIGLLLGLQGEVIRKTLVFFAFGT